MVHDVGEPVVGEVDPTGEGLAVWREVFAGASNTSAYLTPAWTASWLATFVPSLHPRQLVVFAGGRSNVPIGTCLLTVRSDPRAGFPLRRGYINTDGEPAKDSAVIEHNAILACAGREQEVYAAVARFVASTSVDELRFTGANAHEIERLRTAFPEWSADIEWKDSPFVDLRYLRAEDRDLLRALSRNSREQVRRSLRQFERHGPLRLEWAQNVADADTAFRHLVELHRRYWESQGEVGGFATAARHQFHSHFINAGVSTSNAQLLSVRCGDRLLGVVYNLVHDGRVAFYQSGFDYTIEPRSRPGLVCHYLAISHYLEAGYSEYDFLPSAPGEGRYKQSLANANRQLGTLTLYRPGWRTMYFNTLRRMRPYMTSRTS